MLDFGTAISWFAQPAAPGCYQAKLTTNLDLVRLPELVSHLAKLKVSFEIESFGQSPERYLFHPGLGIHRQQLNEAGEVLLREDAVASALNLSQGSLVEFERRLRLIRGTAWLDLLEIYRYSGEIRLLPRAV